MKFLDEVVITVVSGNGGAGASSFRREKYVAEGGPDGGDGGAGGSIIFVGSRSYNTLYHLKRKKIYKAQDGFAGSKTRKSGKKGNSIKIFLPIGTIIKDSKTGEVILDILKEEEYLFLIGGKGGLGNWHFKNSINRTPSYAQPGIPGETKEIKLELKSVADVGLIGYPNVGKSTFISVVSNARPKVADYPFTTIVPNLGVVNIDSYNSFVIADIPGIIEGAHKGDGLGLKFLKHIERTKLFLHIVEYNPYLSIDQIFETFNNIRFELGSYEKSLLNRPYMIAVSKKDLIIDNNIFEEIEAVFNKNGFNNIFFISSINRDGVKELLYSIYNKIEGRGIEQSF